MKIAIVHYHLKPGGVTTVIRQQIAAIQKFGESLIITGENTGEAIPAKTICIPGIAYDLVKPPSIAPEEIASAIIEAIRSHWPNGCDLIHIHNPTLAKNKDFLKIIKALQTRGQALFLQIHDFAEDGRPTSYFKESYPKNCHYGVINKRDYRLLLMAGLKSSGTHIVENTIGSETEEVQSSSSSSHILYPVRAIRRKNIGEAILISQFIQDDLPLLITLPPNSPSDFESYRFWQDFVRQFKLNVQFEAGVQRVFKSLVSSSKFILTTSITEGFGFAFIEPWLFGKPIWGRYLPGICDNFEKAKISLSHLYRCISIPLEWIAVEDYYNEWESTVCDIMALYQQPVNRIQIRLVFENLTRNRRIDFAVLNEGYQARIIKRVLINQKDKQKLMRLNPFLQYPGKIDNVERLVETNRAEIKNHFNPFAYQTTLEKTYQQVINNPIYHKINRQRLVEYFVNLENFGLLKWGNFSNPDALPLNA